MALQVRAASCIEAARTAAAAAGEQPMTRAELADACVAAALRWRNLHNTATTA